MLKTSRLTTGKAERTEYILLWLG